MRTNPCINCHGTGKILAYLYPKPKGRRGPWPPEGAAAEGRRDKEVRGQSTKDGSDGTGGLS